MDDQRSKKTRSLGANPATSKHSTSGSNAQRRSDHAEKHYSVPVVVSRRQSEAPRASEGLKISDGSRRVSKAGSRDASAVRTPIDTGDPQTTDQRRSSTSVKANTQVSHSHLLEFVTLLTLP